MTTANDDLVARLRVNFEGREAIYIEKGALRVRVLNVWADPARRAAGAEVEEIPTRGFERSLFHERSDGPTPLRWSIGGGFLTAFNERVWVMGYGGWSLYFAPHIIEGVLGLAASWPDALDPGDRYDALCEWVFKNDPYGGPTRRAFDEPSGGSGPADAGA